MGLHLYRVVLASSNKSKSRINFDSQSMRVFYVPLNNVPSLKSLIGTSSLLGRFPVQLRSCLCLRTHPRLHVEVAHAGHLYLAGFSLHTSHWLAVIEFFSCSAPFHMSEVHDALHSMCITDPQLAQEVTLCLATEAPFSVGGSCTVTKNHRH